MVNETVSAIVNTTESYFSLIVEGVIILIVGFALGILAQKLLSKILKEVELNHIMGKVGITHNLEKWISLIVSYVIYLVFIVFFLNRLGITSIVLYLIVGAILMLLILTFIVGLKDVIPNLVAWIILHKDERITVGRRVEVKEISGRVEKIGYLETEIITEYGDTLYVPNTLFLKSKFKVKKE
ncbi:MAG TPA: mechanosensitive ion channel domain-containing protein [Candidatus Nanoarchaeia archaeon]|nr:mechanosensitive ion channel domain-containing protein [Candidatus Nanoarchaeia archaeon]